MSSADEVSTEELAEETSRVQKERAGAKKEHNKRAAALARLKAAKEAGKALLDSDVCGEDTDGRQFPASQYCHLILIKYLTSIQSDTHYTYLSLQDDDDAIYEYVDEEEYARRTREQAASDFVVDDGMWHNLREDEIARDYTTTNFMAEVNVHS